MTSEDPVASPMQNAASEEAFFFERSLDFLAVVGLDGYFKRINRVFTETLGYSEVELLAKPFIEFVHPDDRAATLTEMDQLLSGAPTLQFANRYRAKDGSYRWLSWTASPQLERGVIYGIARDVTQQKQTEADLHTAYETLEKRVAERTAELEKINRTLQESEHRLRMVLEHIPDAFIIYDAQRRIQFINAAGLTLTGRPIEEFLGFTDEEIYPREITDAYLPLLKRAVETKRYQSGECTIALPNRLPHTIVVQYVPLLNAHHEIQQIFGITHDITQRKQAEDRIRRSEQQIRRILDGLFSFVGVMTPDGILIEANRKALEAADLHPEDVLGKPFEETYWWAYCEDLQVQLRDAIARAAQGEMVRYDAVVRVKGQQFVTIDFTLVPIVDETGRVDYLIPSGIDITERKQAENALRESQAQAQRQLAEIETIYQSAPIGLNVLDTDLRFVRINQRLAEMNGISVEAHIGRTVREVLPDMADAAEQILRLILETGEPRLNVEIVGETPAQPGVQRVWLESFWPLKDGGICGGQSQRIIGISTVCEEITERKQAEEALRESEDRLRMAIASAQLGTWDWNLVTGELKWDAGCKAMFGLPPDAESNLDLFFEALHPEDRDRLQVVIQEALDPALGGSYDTQYRAIGIQDKVERWLRAKGQAYYDPTGKPLRFSGTVLEITEQKQVEAQREQFLRQAQAAREAAEHANRVKDEFLAVLSHELRTPLNPILGWAKILQSPQTSSEKLQQGLSTIERNAKHQVQLIEDLLDISRIIRGQLTLHFVPVDLSEPIMAALETVRLAADAKAMRIEVVLDPSVGQIKGDPDRLQQVVWNLLSNAIKFTPSGGQITVRLERVGDREQEASLASSVLAPRFSPTSPTVAQIIVTDTGKGIHPTFLPHVFELFRQQDSSTTRAFGGLGLGLAIVRQVVEAHGGTITASSAGEGQGATFTVQLPLMPTLSPEIPVSSTPLKFEFENLRVVVVDDEVDSLELVRVILEQEGAIVYGACSGQEALQILAQNSFDLLISDIGMPEMDGYVFIRQLRGLSPQANWDIPAIALTAYAGAANRRQILAAGFQAYLAKPIDPQQLLGAIATVISP